jgi:protein-disulfide isomerase
MIARIAIVAFLLTGMPAAFAQQLGSAEFAIKDSDGEPMSNHALSAEQVAKVARLPGLVDVGDARDDVTLYEFYDLNCPFCREAAADVDTLIRTDAALRLVFVPYPVLSAASVEGARVELAVRELASPKKFLEFHRKIYAGRGIVDGNRALAVTREMGLDQQKIIDIANAQRTTDIMTVHAKLGSALKLMATPAYVIQGVAILGHPGLEPLRKAIASVRTCKKVVC